MNRYVWAATILATSTFGASALAQQATATGEGAAAAGPGTTTSVTAEATAPAPAPVAAPVAPVPPPPAVEVEPAPAGNTDHDGVVGHIAFGFMGYDNIPYGAMASADTNATTTTAKAPVIGMRLWLSRSLGIDAGLGFTTTFGTHQEQAADGTTTSTNATAPT